MIYYTNIEARRIVAKLAGRLGRKLGVLDLFCKVTPNVGAPYFMPNKYPDQVSTTAEELGITGQHVVVAQETPIAPVKKRFGRFTVAPKLEACISPDGEHRSA